MLFSNALSPPIQSAIRDYASRFNLKANPVYGETGQEIYTTFSTKIDKKLKTPSISKLFDAVKTAPKIFPNFKYLTIYDNRDSSDRFEIEVFFK